MMTDRSVRIARSTPLPVTIVTLTSILVFLSVGAWLLSRTERGIQRLGWFLLLAASSAGVIFACSSYATMALKDPTSWSGVRAGWFADVLFVFTIAMLFPHFLTLLPNGHPTVTAWRRVALISGWTSAALLLISTLYENQLFTQQILVNSDEHIPAPWAATRFSETWSQPAAIIGIALLVFAISSAVMAVWSRAIHPRTTDSEWAQLKWFIYGLLIALVALVPYLMMLAVEASVPHLLVVAAPLTVFPSAHAWIRAWAAVAVAAIAIAAVPAAVDEPWRPGQIRRLAWSALAASILTIVHEAGVLMVAHQVERDAADKASFGVQVVVMYVATLIVALALEPMAEAGRGWLERHHDRKTPPEVLLEHALSELSASKASLDGVASRNITALRQRGSAHRFVNRLVLAGSGTRGSRHVREDAIWTEIHHVLEELSHRTEQVSARVAELHQSVDGLAAPRPDVINVPDLLPAPPKALDPLDGSRNTGGETK
jgi:hypothetical protein